jgi:hypothetical protein
VEIKKSEPTSGWTYSYMDELHTFVARWTELDPKSFKLDYDLAGVKSP